MSDVHLRHGLDESDPEPPRSLRELVVEGVMALPHLVGLVARLMRDRRVPLRRKLLVGAAVAYLVSPVDLLPDSIPFIGQADDVVLLAFAVNHLLEGAPPDVRAEYWKGSDDALTLVSAVAAWGAELVPSKLRRFLGE